MLVKFQGEEGGHWCNQRTLGWGCDGGGVNLALNSFC